jgi:hypothetical protein
VCRTHDGDHRCSDAAFWVRVIANPYTESRSQFYETCGTAVDLLARSP